MLPVPAGYHASGGQSDIKGMGEGMVADLTGLVGFPVAFVKIDNIVKQMRQRFGNMAKFFFG